MILDFHLSPYRDATSAFSLIHSCQVQYGTPQSTALTKEYGVSYSALSKWIKQYSEVRLDDDTIMTAKQIKDLQKRNAQLEEENLILKKAIAIFTPHSNKD